MADDKKIIFSMVGVSKVFPPQKQVLKNIYLSFFYGAKIGIIFLRGQTYINIFIVYICPDENSVYFYLSCVPSSAILRGMITCYVSAYCKTQMHILPPECLQKTFSKGLLSNFPVSKRFFFPAYFSRRITRHLQSFSSIAYP